MYQLRGIRARKALSAEGRPHLRGFPRNTDSVDCDEGAFHRSFVVIDVYSRRVVGWAIDSAQRADLAASALGMAIDSRSPAAGGIIHGDHGTQFTSGTFTERARKAGLLPSLGSIGDPYDNAVAESFWGRLQTGLLDRQRWNTRIELANAIFEYIEGFHNRRRRHSALGWQAPIDFENATLNRAPTPQIRVQATGS